MHVLIELWKARAPWLELATARREEYLATVMPAIDQLLSDGVELVAMEVAGNGSGNSRGNGPGHEPHEYDYWAVWRLPSEDQLDAFRLALEKVGWLDFFEQVSLDVEGRTVEDILGR
jgi:hypothetical protein